MGLAIPKAFTRAVGVSDHAYHLIALTIPGTIADIAVVLGLIGLIFTDVWYTALCSCQHHRQIR